MLCNHRSRHSLFFAAALTLLPLISSSVIAQKPVVVASQISKPAYIIEVRRQLLAAGSSSVNTEAILSRINGMNMSEIIQLADVANASQLERLMPGVVSSAANAARNPIDAARAAGSNSGNNATAGAVRGQTSMSGGFVDKSGYASVDASSCIACKATTSPSGQTAHDTDPSTTTAGNGDKMETFSDGSVRFSDPKTGTAKEHYNAGGRFVPDPYRPKNSTTPNPERQTHSGIITRGDIKGIAARRGSNITPTGEESTGTGGGIVATRTSTLGLFTESQSEQRISIAQLQEIMRLSVEKLGPKLR